MSQLASPSFSLHHLRYGTTQRLPRWIRSPYWSVIDETIVGAHAFREALPVDQTPFRLAADCTNAADGNALFEISAAAVIGRGHLQPGTVLYRGAVAVQLATAPLAWRNVLSRYLAHVVAAPCLASLHAPGAMPRQMPWCCGFSIAEYGFLDDRERKLLELCSRIASALLIDRCEAICGAAVARDGAPPIDPEQYPELRDEEQ